MAATNGHSKAVALAAKAPAMDPSLNGESAHPTMPYACQECTRRKVKCNKCVPVCSTCQKSKADCIYQAPAPRRRKRKLSGDGDSNIIVDVNEKLAQYERILKQHGLLPQEAVHSPEPAKSPEDNASFRWNRWNELETSKTGTLLAGQGKSRYIDSNLWRNLGDEDEMERMSDDEDGGNPDILKLDPLTGALMESQQSLLQYHPTHHQAVMLWETHVENVEPICKVLHIPSTSTMIRTVSQQPAMATKNEECIMFAVYHFATFSMSEEECLEKYQQSRKPLLQLYNFATRQALVNANFLKTTEISVIQALVLFLLPGRHLYDPHTYWILTGVAMRIGQRMGLHRDGEQLGLLPFEVQMRRRLFYQLLPLDGVAARMIGVGMSTVPDSWDVQHPLNINDDQIWPGMTEAPDEQIGATDMLFCLARSCMGKLFAKVGNSMYDSRQDHNEAEPVILEAEKEVEEKYIRYCDIINPLHVLTIGLARSAITALRLRIRLPKVKNQTLTDTDKREMFRFAQKIMDTDTATYSHTSLRRFLWHVRTFFVWGSWDSLIFVLTTLRNPNELFSSGETDAAWNRVQQVYKNHDELLESRHQPLHIAVGRLALRAWEANPPSHSVPEPAFITTLRSLHERNAKRRVERQGSTTNSNFGSTTDATPYTGPSPGSDDVAMFGDLSNGMSLDLGINFNLDTADWLFWDKLIQDYQTQPQ